MTPHTWVLIPPAYVNSHSCGGATRACWTCGRFEANLTPAFMSCEKILSRPGWVWGPGMPLDPFKSIRIGGVGQGQPGPQTVTTAAGGGAGATWQTNPYNPIGGSGLSSQQDAPNPPGNVFDLYVEDPKPEDIPGITEPGIDKDAYDEFMRGL